MILDTLAGFIARLDPIPGHILGTPNLPPLSRVQSTVLQPVLTCNWFDGSMDENEATLRKASPVLARSFPFQYGRDIR